MIAYNTAPGEGDLTIAATSEIRKRLESVPGITIQEFDQLDWVEGRETGSEIRQWLVGILLALMFVEQALAYRLGYHPPRTSERMI